jgi:hypothetical protein
MGHTTTYRILLRKAGKARIATTIDSPYQIFFTLIRFGLLDSTIRSNQFACLTTLQDKLS